MGERAPGADNGARETSVRRWVRWPIVGCLTAVVLLLPDREQAVWLLGIVAVTLAFLWAFAPQRLGQSPARAIGFTGILIVVAPLARGPLPIWVPIAAVLLVVVIPPVVALLDDFLQSQSESDRVVIGWAVWGRVRQVLRVVSAVLALLVPLRVSGDAAATLALAPAAIATAAGWPSIGVAVVIVTAPFFAGSMTWAVVGVVTAAVAVSHRRVRPPRRSVEFPFSPRLDGHPVLRMRVRRIDRFLSRSAWADADRASATMLERADGAAATTAALRAARARLELTDLQGATDALELAWTDGSLDVGATVRLLQGEVLARSGQPEAALASLDESRRMLPHHVGQQARVSLAAAGVLIDLNQFADANHQAELALRHFRGTKYLVERMRATRLLAVALWRLDDLDRALEVIHDALAIYLSVRWIRQYVGAVGRSRDDQDVLFSEDALMLVEFVRLEILELEINLDPRVEPKVREGDDPDQKLFHDLEMYSVALDMAGASLDRAEVELLTASVSAARGRHQAALISALGAVVELDGVRHRLRTQADRVAWATSFNRGLAMALEFAVASQDSTRVAELIELARVQAFPLLGTGRGEDEVALQDPPTVRVRGRASVAREALSPLDKVHLPPIDLEHAAACAAGPDAWWLSFWHDGATLTWALVPPAGEIAHGRLSGERYVALCEALEELEANLPVPIGDEGDADVDLRLFGAPLRRYPDREAQLSDRLARLVLPDRLRLEAARRHRTGQPPLRLAIAPDPFLAHVPWALLVLDHTREPTVHSLRLCEAVTWTLAPSATLLVLAGDHHPTEEKAPLGLAVLDPADVPSLPAARSLADQLEGVPVLGGRHWNAELGTPQSVLQAMAESGRNSSVLFGCHAVQGDAQRPSSSALVLAAQHPGSRSEMLTAAALFARPIPQGSFPRQISLQACDTSDIRSASSGEWLSLAPAFLAAGAQVVGTTQFPLVDVSDAAATRMVAALLRGDDLQEIVRATQTDGLRRWRSHEGTGIPPIEDTPLAWAAHAVIATGRSGHDVPEVSPLRVTARTFRALERAARTTKVRADLTVTSGRLLATYLSSESQLLDGSALAEITRETTLDLVSRWVRAQPAPGIDRGIRPSTELLEAAERAGALAAATGWLHPEHLIAAALDGSRTPAARIVRILGRRKSVALRRTLRANLRDAELRRDEPGREASSDSKGYIEAIIAAANRGATLQSTGAGSRWHE